MQTCKESIDDTDKTPKTSQISLVAKPQALLDDSKLETEMSRKFFFSILIVRKLNRKLFLYTQCIFISEMIPIVLNTVQYSQFGKNTKQFPYILLEVH